MDQTLKQVPAASRKTYITIQALVRAQFHRDEEGKRRETLCTLLRNCESGSVMRRELGLGAASGPQAWRSKSARHARSRRLLAFLRSHSLKSVSLHWRAATFVSEPVSASRSSPFPEKSVCFTFDPD